MKSRRMKSIIALVFLGMVIFISIGCATNRREVRQETRTEERVEDRYESRHGD